MPDSFRIYEALLWEPGGEYFLLERHLARLSRSATHFGFKLDLALLRARLTALAAGLEQPRKVRAELSADGALLLEHLDVKPSSAVHAALARAPIDSRDEFLRHKTSRRGVYEAALAARPG